MNSAFSIVARRAYTLGGRQVHKPNMNNMPMDKEPWTNEMMTSAPEWNEKLATESEAAVKADHEPVKNVDDLKGKTEMWFRQHDKEKGFEMDVE